MIKLTFARILIFIFACNSFINIKSCMSVIQQEPTGAAPLNSDYSPSISGHYYFATANNQSNDISVFSVNQSNGTMSPIAGSPFSTGVNAPFYLNYSPTISNNNYLAVTFQTNNTVSVYQVNPSDGTISIINTYATGNGPNGLSYSPQILGNYYLAVANRNSNNITIFSVDNSNGTLTPVGSFAAGSGCSDVSYSPSINGIYYLAATNTNTNTISVFQVNLMDGSLTPLPNSPFVTGFSPNSVSFSPDINGNYYLAVTNGGKDNITIFKVDTLMNSLTEIPNSPFVTGLTPISVDYSQNINGNYYLAAASLLSPSVCVYKVNLTDGTLTNFPGSPFTTNPNNRPNNVVFSPTIAGNYYLATANGIGNISVFEINDLAVTITSTNATTFCDGGNTTLMANASGGTAPYSYQWTNNGVAISNATNSTYTATTLGNYAVTVTDSSTPSCSITSDIITVTVNVNPTVTIISPISPANLCEGQSITLTAVATGQSPLNYTWKKFNNTIQTGSSNTYTIVNAQSSDQASYAVTVTDANNCEITSNAVQVNVNPTPIVTITGNTEYCAGSNTKLTANTLNTLASSYLWYTNTAKQITATQGEYTVIVKDSNNCSSSKASVIVTENPNPTVTISGNSQLCNGSTKLTANANGGTAPYKYSWNNGAKTKTIKVTSTGQYTVTVSDVNNCNATATIEVTKCK